ncbi:MAG: YfhO family protein [Bacteroidota bacterium]
MNKLKPYLPHLIAIASFLVITMVYFSPLFAGKQLKQSDIANWEGMSKAIDDFRVKYHEEPLWTNSMFGGMPAYQISVVYPANLIQYINKVIWLGLPSPANLLWGLMIGFYFLLIVLKVDKRIALLGSVGFALSSYFLIYIETGHNTQAHAIAFMAPVIAGIIMTYRGKWLLGTAITGLMIALELYANHLQITYYLILIIVLLGIAEFIRANREKTIPYFLKATASLAFIAVVAGCTNITNLMATAEYGKYSTRGPSELTSDKENKTSGLDRDYVTGWSYGVGESFTLFIPNFKGGVSEPISKSNKDALKNVDSNYKQNIAQFGAYYGDLPFTGGPSYVGAIICLLFIIGLFIIKGEMKWWILSATILGLMLSWGKHFMSFTNFFLDYVPGYDKFRTVSMTLTIVQFMMPLLAVLALDKIVKETDWMRRNIKKLYYGGGIVIGISILILVAPTTFTSFYTQEEYDSVSASIKDQHVSQDVLDGFFTSLENARKSIMTADAMRTFFLVLMASILIYTFVRYKFRDGYIIWTLAVLIFLDLWIVDKRYLADDDYARKTANSAAFPMTQADEMILHDTSSYRVLNLAANTFNDASTSYYHQSIGGYHGAKLKRYKEMIDYTLTPEMADIKSAIQKKDSLTMSTLFSQRTINMMNTKYLIINPDASPIQNQGALGNAWFVNEVKIVPDADAELAGLRTFDPKTTVLVDQRFKEQFAGVNPTNDSSASIKLESFKLNDLVYKSNSSVPQVAVFSEIYYDKGWNAYVDGQKSDYCRANYVLRGMKIPAGSHTIEWKFEPEVYVTGEKISLVSSALLILLIAGAGFVEYKKDKSTAGSPLPKTKS